jgi:hypothetical protein
LMDNCGPYAVQEVINLHIQARVRVVSFAPTLRIFSRSSI